MTAVIILQIMTHREKRIMSGQDQGRTWPDDFSKSQGGGKRGEKSQHQHHARFVFAHDQYKYIYIDYWASRVALVVRNLSANAGHVRDAGSVRGQGDHLQEEMTAHSSILAWTGKSHRQRRLVGYSAWGWEESDMTEATEYTRVCVCMVVCYMCICIHMCVHSTYGLSYLLG